MRHTAPLLLVVIILAFSACKGEKKVATYEDLYKEKPLTILVAQVQDNSQRILPKTTQDEVLNSEFDMAAHYLRQSCLFPFTNQGYYAIPPLASDIILQKYGKTYRQLSIEDIKPLYTEYGVDALLLVAIHKWQQPEVNEIVVYVEYTLRSTKSGLELMHIWVRGNKMQPVDDKGEPYELASDNDFIRLTNIDSRLANRCILLSHISDFALRNIPTSSSRWMYQQDKYVPSNPAFYGFTILTDGSIERNEYNEDAFGNECFIN